MSKSDTQKINEALRREQAAARSHRAALDVVGEQTPSQKQPRETVYELELISGSEEEKKHYRKIDGPVNPLRVHERKGWTVTITPERQFAELASYTAEQKELWEATLKGPGFYDVLGPQAYTFLVNKIARIVNSDDDPKTVLVIGDAERCEEFFYWMTNAGVIDGVEYHQPKFFRFSDRLTADSSDYVPLTVRSEMDTDHFRDFIATSVDKCYYPIAAVVLFEDMEKGPLTYLDKILKVKVWDKTFSTTVNLDEEEKRKETKTTYKKESQPQYITPQVFSVVTCDESEVNKLGSDPEAILTGKSVTLEDGDVQEKEHLSYLWQDYLPLKKLIHLCGGSGEGKSPLSVDLAARISAGLPWPDNTPNTMGPRTVILMSSEDDYADTIRPRLELAGANLKKIKRVKQTVTRKDATQTEVSFALKTDLERLIGEALKIPDLALVIIDPITNYLAGVNMNREDEVREILMQVVDNLVTPLRVSVMTIGHLNKRERGTDPKDRVMGARAFYGVARFVYFCGDDEDAPAEDKHSHVMTQDRGVGAQAIKYRTEAVDQTWAGQTSKVVRIVWGKKCNADAQSTVDQLSKGDKRLSAESAAFIREVLKSGKKPAQEVQDQHKKALGRDCTDWTRARRLANVGTIKEGSSWFWYIKSEETAPIEFDSDKDKG